MLFGYQPSLGYNLYQESAASSSGQFSIPSCTKCDAGSEPTCSGTTSPQCPNDDSDLPSCQLVGDTCAPSCPGTVQDPNTGFPVPATPFCNTKYLIIDGDGAGIKLFSTSDNPLKITHNENSTTFSDGLINTPDEKCPGTNFYFTGTIFNFVFNSLAPAPTCGWGHVVIFKKLPERLSLLSDIITTNKDASSNTQAFFAGSFEDALILTNTSLTDLQTFQNLIIKSKDIKSRNKKIILKNIRTAFKENQIAKSNLSGLTEKRKNTEMTDADLLKRDAAITALSKAYDNEAEILKTLLKFDVIK